MKKKELKKRIKNLEQQLFDLKKAIATNDVESLDIAKKEYYLQVDIENAFWGGTSDTDKKYDGILAQMEKGKTTYTKPLSAEELQKAIDDIEDVPSSLSMHFHAFLPTGDGTQECVICGIKVPIPKIKAPIDAQFSPQHEINRLMADKDLKNNRLKLTPDIQKSFADASCGKGAFDSAKYTSRYLEGIRYLEGKILQWYGKTKDPKFAEYFEIKEARSVDSNKNDFKWEELKQTYCKCAYPEREWKDKSRPSPCLKCKKIIV